MFGEYVLQWDAEIVYSDALPSHIRAFVLPRTDGGHRIVVNQNLSDEAKRKAVEHELFHIAARDIESPLPVILIESDRQNKKTAPAE